MFAKFLESPLHAANKNWGKYTSHPPDYHRRSQRTHHSDETPKPPLLHKNRESRNNSN